MEKSSKQTYQPTAEQLDRAQMMKRYNRFTLYTPLILLALSILILTIALIWLSTAGADAVQWRGHVSSIADMVIVLTTIPLLLACAILPVGAIALVATGRQKEWQPLRRIQLLLWRLESLIGRTQVHIDQYTPQVIEKTIAGNRQVTYFMTIINRLAETLFYTTNREPTQHDKTD